MFRKAAKYKAVMVDILIEASDSAVKNNFCWCMLHTYTICQIGRKTRWVCQEHHCRGYMGCHSQNSHYHGQPQLEEKYSWRGEIHETKTPPSLPSPLLSYTIICLQKQRGGWEDGGRKGERMSETRGRKGGRRPCRKAILGSDRIWISRNTSTYT